MSRDLVQLLRENIDNINEEWAKTEKEMKSTSYETRPLDELRKTTRECVEGYIEILESGSFARIRPFIARIARFRSGLGFKLSEVQRAFYLFRSVVWPIIKEEYGQDSVMLADSLERIDNCLSMVIFEFSEAYQQQVTGQINNYVQEIEEFNRKLELLSITDGLTGLFNHRHFQESLSREISRAERYHRPLALLIIDIDYFKKYNDIHGHLRGDTVLKEMAQIMRLSTREIDIIARYGGEEFVIILPETNPEASKIVAERVRKRVEEYRFFGAQGEEVKLTVSIGLAAAEIHPIDKYTLVNSADEALYRAKESGRNQVCSA